METKLLASIISRQFDDAATVDAPSGRDKLAAFQLSPGSASRKTPQLTASCLTTRQELEALRTEWLALEDACNDSSLVFQSHDWCRA